MDFCSAIVRSVRKKTVQLKLLKASAQEGIGISLLHGPSNITVVSRYAVTDFLLFNKDYSFTEVFEIYYIRRDAGITFPKNYLLLF